MRWFDPAYQNLVVGNANTTLDGSETTLISQDGALREMNILDLGGVINIKSPSFGGKGDGSTDNTAAFNSAVSQATSSGARVIYFPAGSYSFSSKPNPLPVGIALVGQGKRNTFLIRNYTAGGSTEGFIEWTGGSALADGGGCVDICLYAGTGTTLGAAFKISGTDDNHRAGHGATRGLEITGNGQWDYGIYADGSALTTSGSQGLRDQDFEGLEIFRCAQKSVYVKNAVAWYFANLSSYPGGVGNADITIDGGGTALTNSTAVQFSNLYCLGTLTLQNCDQVSANGQVNVLSLASTCTNWSLPLRMNTVLTWTPVIKGTSTAGTQTYTTQYGDWSPMSDGWVKFKCFVALSSFDAATSGTIVIDGLPLPAVNTTNAFHAVSIANVGSISLTAGYSQFEGYIAPGESRITLQQAGNNVAAAVIDNTLMHAASKLIVTAMYKAS